MSLPFHGLRDGVMGYCGPLNLLFRFRDEHLRMDLVFFLLRIGGHLYCGGIHVFPVDRGEHVEVQVVLLREDPDNSVVDLVLEVAGDNTAGEGYEERVDPVRIGVCVPMGIEDKDFQGDSLLSLVFRRVY